MSRWQLIIDIEKCENCNNCFLACKDEHVENNWPGYSDPQPRHGHRWMNIKRVERGQYPLIDVAYRPTPCMHCDDPACLKAASSGQVEKRPDGLVLIKTDRAKGNKSIVKACPYDAIWWNETENVAQKCTMCAHLLDTGWDKPRCVQVCPTGALTFIDTEDEIATGQLGGDSLEVLHPEYKTSPIVKYKNLYRFDKCFIAGSVAYNDNDQEECAFGAEVTLTKDSSVIAKTNADEFGDFKIDNLDYSSGKYSLKITFQSYKETVVDVDLKESVSLDVIIMS